MTVLVVDRLQADDIDVGDGEQGRRPTGSLDLALEVCQPRRAHARAGQLVGLGDRELLEQRVTVDLCLQAVTRGLFAVAGGLFAICRGAGSTLDRRCPVGCRIVAVLHRAVQEASHRAPVVCAAGVALREVKVAQRSGLIARSRAHVAGVRDDVTIRGRVDASLGDLLTLLGAAIAKVARELVLAGVAAARELAITGGLVAVGRGLVAVRGGLVAVGGRLIDIREGLIAILERLGVLERARGRSSALGLSAAHSVRGVDQTIA
jgi:hypothetical protein